MGALPQLWGEEGPHSGAPGPRRDPSPQDTHLDVRLTRSPQGRGSGDGPPGSRTQTLADAAPLPSVRAKSKCTRLTPRAGRTPAGPFRAQQSGPEGTSGIRTSPWSPSSSRADSPPAASHGACQALPPCTGEHHHGPRPALDWGPGSSLNSAPSSPLPPHPSLHTPPSTLLPPLSSLLFSPLPPTTPATSLPPSVWSHCTHYTPFSAIMILNYRKYKPSVFYLFIQYICCRVQQLEGRCYRPLTGTRFHHHRETDIPPCILTTAQTMPKGSEITYSLNKYKLSIFDEPELGVVGPQTHHPGAYTSDRACRPHRAVRQEEGSRRKKKSAQARALLGE